MTFNRPTSNIYDAQFITVDQCHVSVMLKEQPTAWRYTRVTGALWYKINFVTKLVQFFYLVIACWSIGTSITYACCFVPEFDLNIYFLYKTEIWQHFYWHYACADSVWAFCLLLLNLKAFECCFDVLCDCCIVIYT